MLVTTFPPDLGVQLTKAERVARAHVPADQLEQWVSKDNGLDPALCLVLELAILDVQAEDSFTSALPHDQEPSPGPAASTRHLLERRRTLLTRK